MRLVIKAASTALTVAALAVGTGIATGGPSRQPVRLAADVKGPCDEAEHANDPRCSGAQTAKDDPAAEARGRNDVSSLCDEAEHANDPRCSGAGADADHDESALGSDDAGLVDDSGRSEDSHGSGNSGPGSNDEHGGSGRAHAEDD